MHVGDPSHSVVLTLRQASKRSLDHRDGKNSSKMAAVGSTVAYCHLLGLPVEIRISIYRHLFDNAQLLVDSGCLNSLCSSAMCSCNFPRHILNTCGLVRREATSYLLSATTLHIRNTFNKVFSLPPSYVAAIPRVVILNTGAYHKKPLALEAFHSLKTLELRNITIWCKYHDEAYLQRAESDECMMQLALFNLNRISAQLTQICGDPKRSFRVLLCCQYVASSTTHETIHAVIDIDEKTILHKSKGPAIRERNQWAGFY